MRLNHLSYESDNRHYYFWNISLSCYLGMLLALALTLYSERKKLSRTIRVIIQIVIAGIIVAYYYSLPDHFVIIHIQRFLLFLIGLHLLISFSPFTERGGINGFWQYNKIIFLRILTAVLYSTVLYLGLALAMLAIEKLFKVRIEYKLYTDLWIIIAGIFNTVFFLAGFPSGYEKLEMEKSYPKGLKIFTQYVLLPIISIYLAILYAYMFKIIFTGQWPFGWVSYLVLAFAIAGILSLLLIYPIREDGENKWILVFGRIFYFAICPLVVLLFLAIMRRIREYGITEERYFVFVLSCWLTFIVIYLLINKGKNIKIIPITLCLLAFIISFGSWGAFSVSYRSQSGRLKHLMEKNNLLGPQGFIPAKKNLPEKDADQIVSIVEYLVDAHGYHSLQPFFYQNLDSLMKSDSTNTSYSYMQYNKILTVMHISKGEDADRFFDYNADRENAVMHIAGFDYLIHDFNMNAYNTDLQTKDLLVGRDHFQFSFLSDSGKISIQTISDTAMRINLFSLVKSFKAKAYNSYSVISQDSMTVTGENKDVAIKIIFRNINGENIDDGIKIRQIQADILFRIKQRERASN